MTLPAYTQDPFAKLNAANYVRYNRGDMMVPAGVVDPPIANAIAATPFIGQLMNVHAVPQVYTRPNANARPTNAIGMITPTGSGS